MVAPFRSLLECGVRYQLSLSYLSHFMLVCAIGGLQSKDQTGWSQVFAPPRTDGPGNYNNHEQNGGRLFSVSKMVLESTLYPQAVDDWAEQVRGATAIAEALLQHVEWNVKPSLPFAQLVRTPMPQGSLAQAYCTKAYGPSGKVCRCISMVVLATS